ncbi:MAG: hypothetical protein U0802_15265 [Candidatus Binatia bacterium]
MLETLLELGVNRIDTAACVRRRQLRISPWMARHRGRFFLASKTHERCCGRTGHRAAPLDRLQVAQLDLVSCTTSSTRTGGASRCRPRRRAGGAARGAPRAARYFLGVTGHGTWAPVMHRRSLHGAFPSTACWCLAASPCCRTQSTPPTSRRCWPCAPRAASPCRPSRRWRAAAGRATRRRFSWYEPLHAPTPSPRRQRAMLARPGLFLNSSSDAACCTILTAAAQPAAAPSPEAMRADAARFAVEPLFVRGVSDADLSRRHRAARPEPVGAGLPPAPSRSSPAPALRVVHRVEGAAVALDQVSMRAMRPRRSLASSTERARTVGRLRLAAGGRASSLRSSFSWRSASTVSAIGDDEIEDVGSECSELRGRELGTLGTYVPETSASSIFHGCPGSRDPARASRRWRRC